MFTQCCIECRKAVELLVNTLYEDFGGPAAASSDTPTTFADKVRFVTGQRGAHGRDVLPPSLARIAQDVWKQSSAFAHGGSADTPPSPPVDDERTAINVFQSTLDFAERFFNNLA